MEKPKETVSSGLVDGPKKATAKTKGSSSGKTENVLDSFEVLEKFSGASLVGKKLEIFLFLIVFVYELTS